MALFLISLIILKIYNVLDYRNNTIRKEIYIFGLKILKLDEISMNNMFAVTNNVIAKSYPPYKNVYFINDVPIEVDKITGLYLQNEVLFLAKDGTVIHLWLGSTIESYDNCIEIVDFISETWSLRKITCGKRNMFVIRFKDKYDIEKKML